MAPISRASLSKGEIQKMNSIVGKSTGIALLMAAALLAALFAMGVFSAGVPVGAHECTVGTNDMGTPIPHNDNADSPVDCAANGHTEAHTGIIKDASVTLSNTASAATGVTMTIEFSVAVGSGEAGRDITVTIPAGVTGYSVEDDDDVSVTQGGADVVSTGTNTIVIDGDAAGNYDADDPIVVKITGLTNPVADQEPGAVTIQQGSDIPAMSIDSSVSASGGQLRLSSTTAGAAVQVVVKAFAETAKTSATDITVNLAKFGVPSSITERSIIIGDDSSTGHTADTTRYIGEPGSVTVSGTKVTLSLYARFPGSSSDTAGTLEDGYTITFKQSAGITNPGTAGTATVSVGDGDTNGHSLTATIQSAVTLSKGSGARGTDVTVTGVGLGGGGATVFLVDGSCADQVADCTEDDDISLGTGPASGGKVEIDIETSSSDFEQGVDQINENGGVATPPYVSTDSLRGKNQITIVDGTGTTADRSAYFTVTPTIAVDEDAVQQGDELTIIVEDWYYGAIDSVTIGAEVVDEDDLDASGSSDDFEIDIIVPPSARLGEQELKVTGILTDNQGSLTAGNKDVAKGSVIIGALAIEVEPSSFVLGQQFTINVKGFSTDDPATGDDDIMLVKVGNHELDETTGGVEIDELSIDTNGFFTNTFRLNSKDQYLKPWRLPRPGGRPLWPCGSGADNRPRTHHYC